MKLLVLDELQRLGRDWSSFLFVIGFELDALTPSRTPKPKRIRSPLVAEQSEPLVVEPSEPARVEPIEPIMMETKKL